MRLTAARLAEKNGRTTFRDEVRREQRPDSGKSKRRLIGEVELVDGAKERERCSTHGAFETSVAAVRDLFLEQRLKELAVRPFLLLRALNQVTPDAAGVGEGQSLEHRVEIDVRVGGAHETPPRRSARREANSIWSAPLARGCAAPERRPSPSLPRALEESARLTPVIESCPSSTARPNAARRTSSPCCSSSAYNSSTRRLDSERSRWAISVRTVRASLPRVSNCCRFSYSLARVPCTAAIFSARSSGSGAGGSFLALLRCRDSNRPATMCTFCSYKNSVPATCAALRGIEYGAPSNITSAVGPTKIGR